MGCYHEKMTNEIYPVDHNKVQIEETHKVPEHKIFQSDKIENTDFIIDHINVVWYSKDSICTEGTTSKNKCVSESLQQIQDVLTYDPEDTSNEIDTDEGI